MAGSSNYWNLADKARERFEQFAKNFGEAFSSLEADDDLGALADDLQNEIAAVREYINTLELSIDPLRDADKALSNIPKLG